MMNIFYQQARMPTNFLYMTKKNLLIKLTKIICHCLFLFLSFKTLDMVTTEY